MNVSKRLISSAMAVVMAASTLVIGSASVSAATLKKPTSVKVTNSLKSVQVTWKKVKGATKYEVYRSGKLLKTTKKTEMKDFNAKAGKSYTYMVKAVKGKIKSKASDKKKIVRLNTTQIAALSNTKTGVKVQWGKRKACDQYLVYRKTSGSYQKVKTTTSTSYTDTSVVSGTKYTYKIVGRNNATGKKSYESTTASYRYITPVTGVTAQESVSCTSVDVKWNLVKGATSYAVYRLKCTDSSYKKIATVSGTSYSDTAVGNNPTAFLYKVVALNGSSQSADSDFRIVQFMPKRDGENLYRIDENNNLHVSLLFNVGDVYAEGKALADYFSLGGLYTVEVVSGANVVSVSDSVITAKAAGTAQLKINISEQAAKIVSQLANNGVGKLSTKTVYIEITVK